MKTESATAPFVRLVDRLLAASLRGLLPEEKRYWLLVPVIGIVAGLVAVLLVHILSDIQSLAWGDINEIGQTSPARRVLVLVLGGVFVSAALMIWKRQTAFKGTAGLIESLAVGGGRIPLGGTMINALISIAAVGMGASLGREGALMHSGAAFGSWCGRTFRLREHHVKILLASGAAAGIAASYNVPIGATVFAMEVLLGSLALDLFGPIIICCVISTSISRSLISEFPAYVIPPDLLSTYHLEHHWEILLALLLGGIVGLVSVAFVRVFSGVQSIFRWLLPLKSLGALLAMAILGIVGIWFPELFGNGYQTVNAVLEGDFVSSDESAWAWIRFLLVLPLLKLFLTALCRGGGIPGGLFTPSLFVGAIVGVGFGLVVRALFPETTAPPSVYALVGMAAIISATMQAPITAILMIFEMTQNYSVILPFMAASIASAVVARLLRTESLYTESLRRSGILLPNIRPPLWVRQPAVRTFLRTDVQTVQAAESFEAVMDAFLRSPKEHDRLYVINQRHEFLGVVSLHEIKTFFGQSDHLETVIAADIMNSHFPIVAVDDPMSTAVELLAESDAERLPVVSDRIERKLLGAVSKRDLLASYRESNLARVSRENRG